MVNPVSLELAQEAKLDFDLSGVSRTVMVNPIQTSGIPSAHFAADRDEGQCHQDLTGLRWQRGG